MSFTFGPDFEPPISIWAHGATYLKMMLPEVIILNVYGFG
jgi:hypothetical protein